MRSRQNFTGPEVLDDKEHTCKDMYLDVGYLMRSKKLTEEEAVKLIQWQSMDCWKPMPEIAGSVLLAGELDQWVEKYRG